MVKQSWTFFLQRFVEFFVIWRNFTDIVIEQGRTTAQWPEKWAFGHCRPWQTPQTKHEWIFWKIEINVSIKDVRCLENSGKWKWMKIVRFWILLTWKTPETYEISWLLHLNRTLRNFLFSQGKVVILIRVTSFIAITLVLQSGVFSILLVVYAWQIVNNTVHYTKSKQFSKQTWKKVKNPPTKLEFQDFQTYNWGKKENVYFFKLWS